MNISKPNPSLTSGVSMDTENTLALPILTTLVSQEDFVRGKELPYLTSLSLVWTCLLPLAMTLTYCQSLLTERILASSKLVFGLSRSLLNNIYC